MGTENPKTLCKKALVLAGVLTACLAAALPLFAAAPDPLEVLNAPPGLELRDGENRLISRAETARGLSERLRKAKPKSPWQQILDELRYPTCVLKPSELFFAARSLLAWLTRPPKLHVPSLPPTPILALSPLLLLAGLLWRRAAASTNSLPLRC